eukprot:jgi/Botrbrau1/6198/Bobra.0344s0038.1
METPGTILEPSIFRKNDILRHSVHSLRQSKLSRDSWKTWDNYALAASASGNLLAAARGLQKVWELTQGQRRNIPALKALVALVVEDRVRNGTRGLPRKVSDESANRGRTSEEALESVVAQILDQYRMGSAPEAEFWEAYADYYMAIGNNETAKEGLFKLIRELQPSWQKDKASIMSYLAAVSKHTKLCMDEYGNHSSKRDLRSKRDLAASRMQLANILQILQKGGDVCPDLDLQAPKELLKEVEKLENGEVQNLENGEQNVP